MLALNLTLRSCCSVVREMDGAREVDLNSEGEVWNMGEYKESCQVPEIGERGKTYELGSA